MTMKQNKLSKMPILDFLEKLSESDEILDAIKKERQESKTDLTVLDQRKEILNKLTGNKGE